METGTNTLESKLKALIQEHESKLHMGIGFDDQIEVVRRLFREYERNAATAIEDAQRFQNDMALWLQGLALCCQMTANAATHGEKNARMRGLVEMIESALNKVREYDYRLDHFNRNRYRPDHLFTNDYPVRHWKDRAEEAERELKALKDKILLVPKEQPNGSQSETEDDFKF